ncbi:MAG: hypothetical protein E6P95_01750 [Candidatus Moraniibacteriota bacterium]|nr:MAG: hypothetical protein E6P95_01750 [Candidatus Moranbacteria bacterium]
MHTLVDWVQLSAQMSAYENFFMPTIQGLGRLDLDLIEKDKEILQGIRSESSRNSIEFNLGLTESFTQAYLWILGAYEAIRTLSQLADREVLVNPTQANKEVAENIRKVKHFFERVRIPLAKMEPSKKYEATDFPTAYPILDTKRGIAWHISASVVVSRQELSDEFLKLKDLLPQVPKS